MRVAAWAKFSPAAALKVLLIYEESDFMENEKRNVGSAIGLFFLAVVSLMFSNIRQFAGIFYSIGLSDFGLFCLIGFICLLSCLFANKFFGFNIFENSEPLKRWQIIAAANCVLLLSILFMAKVRFELNWLIQDISFRVNDLNDFWYYILPQWIQYIFSLTFAAFACEGCRRLIKSEKTHSVLLCGMLCVVGYFLLHVICVLWYGGLYEPPLLIWLDGAIFVAVGVLYAVLNRKIKIALPLVLLLPIIRWVISLCVYSSAL